MKSPTDKVEENLIRRKDLMVSDNLRRQVPEGSKKKDTLETFDGAFNVQDMEQYVKKLGIIEWLGGSEEERTKDRNLAALQRLLIRPRALVRPVGNRDLTTVLLNGKITVTMPICFSPSAFQMYAHADGETATAKGCGKAGALMTLSAWSNKPLEQVKKESGCENMWMNVYIFKHRDRITQLVRRAENAGYNAIVVSVDIPILSRRKGSSFYKEVGKFIEAAHFPASDPQFKDLLAGDPDATWNDFAEICKMTTLPVIAKGIMSAEDAREALKHGASAIFVSNHGGRQLDGAPSTIEVLAEVVREVNGSCDVYVDGGFRSGMDVFKGLALGAKAVFLGRPAFYGLAYNGSDGVQKVLEIMSEQLSRTMALSGCAKLSDITPDRVMTAAFL
uniref:(S)-2-hydroxy-acid oxidase n=1 Tax=Plectus sambesii TaxID=2011161 RepID=A0A914XG18_9BILA